MKELRSQLSAALPLLIRTRDALRDAEPHLRDRLSLLNLLGVHSGVKKIEEQRERIFRLIAELNEIIYGSK